MVIVLEKKLGEMIEQEDAEQCQYRGGTRDGQGHGDGERAPWEG